MWLSVPPGFYDSAIAEFIAKSSKRCNFCKSSQIFIFAADFGLRRVPWRHRKVHSAKERLFISIKNLINILAFSSCPIYKSYIGLTDRKWNESMLLVWSARAALDHATPLYTALGDTVKKKVEFSSESITSQSDHVRRIQIWWRILLKLRISEQTPLMC